jgi:hypothetical protein
MARRCVWVIATPVVLNTAFDINLKTIFKTLFRVASSSPKWKTVIIADVAD